MKISPIVIQVLRSSSPTLLAALALPPPINMLASAVVSSTLARYAEGQGDAPLQPEQVTAAIESNVSNPDFIPALRQAETDLKRYEEENRFRFAELELRDRQSARDFHAGSGISDRIFSGGIAIVWIAVGAMVCMIVGLLFVAGGAFSIDRSNMDLSIAAFGLIGSAVGFINGLAATVVAFYWGSSQGSKDKSAAISTSLEQLNHEVGQFALRQPAPPPPPAPPPAPDATEPASFPTPPADPALIVQMLARLGVQHRHVEGSVTWALTPQGISVEGAVPIGTTGDPATVTRIWKQFGVHCAAAAKRYGVPVELIVATIATESSGDPEAFRQEKNDASVGLMQTLIGTAREALGDPVLKASDLRKPEVSIMAGTAYIARQRDKTNFDPVLVAAAYNAGSCRPAKFDKNRWRLWCHPPESGAHLDRFVARFNDAMGVSRSSKWFDGGCPSFVGAFAAGTTSAPAGTVSALTTSGLRGPVSEQATEVLRALVAPVPLVAIGGHKELVIAVQQKLSEHGYLDPPPDGNFGAVSGWAIGEFRDRNNLNGDMLDRETADLLIDPRAPLANAIWTGNWIDRVVDHMTRNGYWFSRYPNCRNIVYLEGANIDGTLNRDEPDKFNDLRIVFWFEKDGRLMHDSWEATTEPGDFFTDNPLNPKGAARIKFGQYKAWAVGMHRGDHEALVQVADVSVFRDHNRDHIRTGDTVDTGMFGINQHWGYDASSASIEKTSAGCLVGREVKGHKEFMAQVKEDPRYKVNNSYKFVTTILPADKIFNT